MGHEQRRTRLRGRAARDRSQRPSGRTPFQHLRRLRSVKCRRLDNKLSLDPGSTVTRYEIDLATVRRRGSALLVVTVGELLDRAVTGGEARQSDHHAPDRRCDDKWKESSTVHSVRFQDSTEPRAAGSPRPLPSSGETRILNSDDCRPGKRPLALGYAGRDPQGGGSQCDFHLPLLRGVDKEPLVVY